MLVDLPQRLDTKDSFLSFVGQDGTYHVSWIVNDKQMIFFETYNNSENPTSSLSVCSVQDYCKALLKKSKILKNDYITKDHIIKLLDLVEFA